MEGEGIDASTEIDLDSTQFHSLHLHSAHIYSLSLKSSKHQIHFPHCRDWESAVDGGSGDGCQQ